MPHCTRAWEACPGARVAVTVNDFPYGAQLLNASHGALETAAQSGNGDEGAGPPPKR